MLTRSWTPPSRWTCPPSRPRGGVGADEIERHADSSEPVRRARVKIMSDQHLGKLTYLRIYSGTLEPARRC